jgi:hypothetical protein
MTTTFNYQAATAQAALSRMMNAPAGQVAIAGSDWAQGAMMALVQAEQLAAQAGVVPYVTDPTTGTQGVANIGAARALVSKMPKDVQTIYLATYGAVRQANASAKTAAATTPLLSGLSMLEEANGFGALPVIAVVVIACVGLAALIAGAAYVASVKIQVDGANLRQAASVANISALATQQLQQTGKIDPSVWSSLTSLAQTESEVGAYTVPLIVGGGAVAVGAGWFAWRKWFRK